MKRGLALALVALVASGCGGVDDTELTVFAAASLTEAFEELAPAARFNFAGSDQLAAQLREGAEADVYAAASPRYPDELYAERLVERPIVFATNRLVLVVPSESPIGSLDDLERDGVKLVVGAEGVPVGDYTREALERVGRERVLENVVSEEEDVKGVLGKVALGEADAGFVYATDAKAAGDEVRAVELPDAVQVPIRYPAAVVRETGDHDAAEEFVRLLTGERGRQALRRAGFGLP
ncbi:MAG: molybdate ABC transporter substrate-binding protein [Gaiellaceae bacterium]